VVPEQCHVLFGASFHAGQRALEQLVGSLVEEVSLKNAVVLFKPSFLNVVLSASKVHVTGWQKCGFDVHASVGVVAVDLVLVRQLV